MSHVAQPPEAVTDFIPRVCLCREGRGSEALKPEGGWGETVPGSEKYSDPVPRLVCGDQPRCASVDVYG